MSVTKILAIHKYINTNAANQIRPYLWKPQVADFAIVLPECRRMKTPYALSPSLRSPSHLYPQKRKKNIYIYIYIEREREREREPTLFLLKKLSCKSFQQQHFPRIVVFGICFGEICHKVKSLKSFQQCWFSRLLDLHSKGRGRHAFFILL